MTASLLLAGPALWAAPLSLSRLHAELEHLAAASKVRNLKTGEYGNATPEYLASIVSSITIAVREAHEMGMLPEAPDRPIDVPTVDLRPILGVLPELAERGASLAGHARPGSASAFVRKALVSIEFLTLTGGARDRAAAVLPAWQPLHVASQCKGRKKSKDGRSSSILLLQRLGVQNGCATPQALPKERSEIVRWGTDKGYVSHTMDMAISCYHHALKLLPAAEQEAYPCFPRERMCNERHLGMLPDVVDRARRAGCSLSEVAIRDMSALELLKLLAPGVAEDLEDFIAMPRSRPLGKDERLGFITTVSRYVAQAVRLNETHAEAFASGEARTLYFLEHLVTEHAADAHPSRPRSRGLQSRGGPSKHETQAPLLLVVLESEAAVARANSPLTMANNALNYPVSVKDGIGRLWRLIQYVYGGMSESEPETWQLLSLQYQRIQDRMNHRTVGAARSARSITPVALNAKDKVLAIRTVTLPQLVCIGLPVLGHHVDALQARYEAVVKMARRKGHDGTHPVVRAAHREWHEWLTKYVVLALATDDGLRLSNYSYGRLGLAAEFRPTFSRGEDGSLVLRSLNTFFTGTGGTQPDARLKMLERAGSDGERERERRVSPGVVRMDLLLAYIQGPRAENLLWIGLTDRSGAAVTAATYCLEREMAGEYGAPFALFVSYKSPRSDRAYGKNRASEEFGEALHWVARHALGRSVPDMDSDERRELYRGIFSMHISRLFIGTYWLGVRTDLAREGIDRAMHLTDDTEGALRDDYDAVDAAIREARRVYLHDSEERWQHPDAYHVFMDRLYALEILDWAKLTNLPLPSHLRSDMLADVTRALSDAPAAMRRSRTRRAA